MSDRDLVRMMPTPQVPRAFNSSFDGCPVHGTELFKFGNYSWIMDPFRRPWKLKCPVAGEQYPSNDFQAFLDSGMSDRSLLTGDYPDDGWGWKKPGDAKANWFVAYYCHWLWYSYLIPAVLDLSRAYLLTGKEIYGRKCLLMLTKIADYYPQMDHNKQSRYATEFAPDYDGKIVNRIWETNVIRSLAESVANIRGYIDEQTSAVFGKGQDELVTFLEERILVEGLNAIYRGKISGNYGMHQLAMLVILKALGRERESEKGVEFINNNPGGGYIHQGLKYAMDNFIYREGMAYENAPGYCVSWCSNLLNIAAHLGSLGATFPDQDKLKRMVQVPDRLVCMRRYTPSIGDSGSVTSGRVALSSRDVRTACRLLAVSSGRGCGDEAFRYYEDLFLPARDAARPRRASLRSAARRGSDCMGGYGLIMLRTRDLECSLYFGKMNGHGHYDRLGIEVFGCGERAMPDLGYPQFAAESKAPAAWERNTISHNTVVVDQRRQDSGAAGWVTMFHDAGPVQAAEVAANRTYSNAKLYVRSVCLLNFGMPLLVDIFRVKGGTCHDYSVHGQHGVFRVEGVQLRGRPGTVSGEDIPYGYLYDDPDLESPDKTRSFHSYAGSGYSYLYDVRFGVPRGPFLAEWKMSRSTLRLLFPHGAGEVVAARGNPPLRPGNPPFLDYIMLRNRGAELTSVFTAVAEVFREAASVHTAQTMPVEGPDPAYPVGLLIEQDNRRHLVVSSLDPRADLRFPQGEFRGRLLVATMDAMSRPAEVFMDGFRLKLAGIEVNVDGMLEGEILSVDCADDSVIVNLEGGGRQLVGGMALIRNARRCCCYKILDAAPTPNGLRLRLEPGARIGRLVAEKIGEKEVRTQTELLLARYGYYEGARLVDGNREGWVTIDKVEQGRITLSEPLRGFRFPDAYIYEFGPGDRLAVGVDIRLRRSRHGWTGRTNVRATITVLGRKKACTPGRFALTSRKRKSDGENKRAA